MKWHHFVTYLSNDPRIMCWWLGVVTVKTLDLGSRGLGSTHGQVAVK